MVRQQQPHHGGGGRDFIPETRGEPSCKARARSCCLAASIRLATSCHVLCTGTPVQHTQSCQARCHVRRDRQFEPSWRYCPASDTLALDVRLLSHCCLYVYLAETRHPPPWAGLGTTAPTHSPQRHDSTSGRSLFILLCGSMVVLEASSVSRSGAHPWAGHGVALILLHPLWTARDMHTSVGEHFVDQQRFAALEVTNK